MKVHELITQERLYDYVAAFNAKHKAINIGNDCVRFSEEDIPKKEFLLIVKEAQALAKDSILRGLTCGKCPNSEICFASTKHWRDFEHTRPNWCPIEKISKDKRLFR